MITERQLEKEIRNYNQMYRDGKPGISDAEFDRKVEMLYQMNPNNAWFSLGVNDDTPKTRKEKLPIPMFSLEKVKTPGEIKKWLTSLNLKLSDVLIITPKFDGISLCVNEVVGDAWTRGDGHYGQNCKNHFMKMIGNNWGIPAEYEGDEPTMTFGEAIFPTETFLHEIAPNSSYKSARNAVGGILNADEVSPFTNKVCYIRYGCDRTNWDKMKQLEFLNSSSPKNPVIFTDITVESLVSFTNEEMAHYLNELYLNMAKDYHCDGLVIDIDSAAIRNKLGRLPNNNPKYAIAYKDEKWSEREKTILHSIECEISKDGIVCPVGVIEPVDLCGATVERCTLYNMKYVMDKHCVPGAEIIICRSGDVIPKHLDTVSYDYNNCTYISKCPVCGEPLMWDNNKVNLICPNTDCDGRKLSEIVYFFSIMKVEEFGRPTIKKFFDAGYKSVADIIQMEIEEMVLIEGIGYETAQTLYSQFTDILTLPQSFSQITTALNSYHGKLAEKTCQSILNGLDINNAEDADKVYNGCLNTPDMAESRMTMIKGVGDETAIAFRKGIIEFYHRDDFLLWNIGTYKKDLSSYPTFVMSGFRDKELSDKAKEKGWMEEDHLTKKTGLLVLKEKNSTSSKAEKARKYGVRIISIEEFEEMLYADKR